MTEWIVQYRNRYEDDKEWSSLVPCSALENATAKRESYSTADRRWEFRILKRTITEEVVE